eukprot:s658_g12.t1
MRQWKAGTFVPAWKRDMENAAARMHGGTAAGGLDSIPEVVRDAPDDVSEDHTSCSLSSIGVDDQDDPGCGLAERGPPEDRDREGGAVAGLPEDREHGVPRRELGDPARRDGEPPALPAQSGSWGVPAAPTWTKQQWDDWEAWENQQAEDGDDVNLMQRTGAGGNDDVDETDDPPSEGASGSGQAPGGGPPGGPAARPSLCLTLVEQQGLLDAGWPLHHVEHITMFAEYLEDTANQYGIEAVAWGNDGWGDALVMANATAELAQELLWDRLRDVQVVRPEDQAARGRVAVGWAGFQKQLGALHLEIMTEALRHQWLPNGVDDDGRRLPVPPFVRGDHNAWALARARTIARELVQRSRTLGAERRAAQARGERDPGEREPGHDVPVVGVGEGRDQRGDRDDGDASVEDAMEDLADASDEQALMELTAAEERVLDQLDVTTEARRHLRSLLVSLEQLQGHGEGAEYRWGVAQLVQSWDGALGIVNAMRDILQVRTTPMGCLPHYPAVREPRYGPLRTRVGSYMEEFRYMLLRCLSEEGGLRLRELVAGGPTAGVRAEPGAAVETVQAMRSGRNTRRVRRVSGVVPRGSRSRSRTPASELEMPREDGGDIVTVLVRLLFFLSLLCYLYLLCCRSPLPYQNVLSFLHGVILVYLSRLLYLYLLCYRSLLPYKNVLFFLQGVTLAYLDLVNLSALGLSDCLQSLAHYHRVCLLVLLSLHCHFSVLTLELLWVVIYLSRTVLSSRGGEEDALLPAALLGPAAPHESARGRVLPQPAVEHALPASALPVQLGEMLSAGSGPGLPGLMVPLGEMEPSRVLARACSEGAAAAYAADREAREMAVGLAVAGSTFEIPGRDVTLIRPRQLVEGFWLRKISDQHEAAESLKRLAKAAVTLKGLDDEAVLRRLDEAPGAESSAAARDYQLLSRSSVLRLQTSRSMAVLQAYIGKRIQGDGTVLPRLPTLWALFVKAGNHIRDALLSGEPAGPLSGSSEAPGPGPFLCGPFRRLVAQRQASVTRHMEILTELISESAATLFDADDGLDLLGLAEDFYKADCPIEVRQQTVKIFRATAAAIRER